MTNEEMLGVAEIVERATNRFNEQAARFRERSAAYDRLIAEMNADWLTVPSALSAPKA